MNNLNMDGALTAFRRGNYNCRQFRLIRSFGRQVMTSNESLCLEDGISSRGYCKLYRFLRSLIHMDLKPLPVLFLFSHVCFPWPHPTRRQCRDNEMQEEQPR